MKLAALSALVSLAIASPIFERQTEQCSVLGVKGAIPDTINRSAFKRIAGSGTVEQCSAACNHPENTQCKAFAVRTGGSGGACLLFDATVKYRADPTSTYAIYNLPDGVRGGTPNNNPAW